MADEFELIARWFAPLAAAEPGALGLTDDAAVVSLAAGRDLVITTDMLVSDVHFLAADPAESVAVKLLAVNLSDLASMGAEPRGYLLALALPLGWTARHREDWLDQFAAGLAGMQAEYGCPLLGGDTVGTAGPLTLSVTALGTVATGAALRRAGARPGDDVWVSGTIGDGVLGLDVLQRRITLDAALAGEAIARYQRPQPRLRLGRALVGVATACADVSDGLAADLGNICRASGVVGRIEAHRVPLSPAGKAAVAADPSLHLRLLSEGDDYELVFSALTQRRDDVLTAAAGAGVPVTLIGHIGAADAMKREHVQVVDDDGQALDLPAHGWRHFE